MKAQGVIVIVGLATAALVGCNSTATVTDPTAAFADSESAALTGNGREHLIKGCVVQVIKTTDRAAQVKAVSCPDSPNMLPLNRWPGSTEGWVAKSALDIR